MKKSKIAIFYLQFVFLVCLLIVKEFEINNAISIGRYMVLFNLLISFLLFKRIYDNWINPHNLFLFAILFFLLPRVILDIIGYENGLEQTTFYSTYNYTKETVYRILLNLNLAIVSFTIGSSFIKFSKDEHNLTKQNTIHRKIGLALFLIGIPVVLFKLLRTVFILATQGYRALNLGDALVPDSFLLTVFTIFCFLGYYLLIISGRFQKDKLLSIVATFILFASLIADGRRGPGFCFLLIILWYYYYSNNIKINIKKIALVGFLGLSLAIFIGFFRNSKEVTLESFDFLYFFYAQGVSVQVLGYSIDHQTLIDYGIIDLFGNVKRYLSINLGMDSGDQFFARANKYKIYSNYISLLVNKDLFTRGLGIGGGYMAQFYSVGKEIGQIIGGVFLGMSFSKFVYCSLDKKLWGHLLLLLLLPYLIYIPRDNIFDFLTDNLLFLILLMFFYLLLQLTRNIKFN